MTVCPMITVMKLYSMRQRIHKPTVVPVIPMRTPTLNPYLSRAMTDGKFKGKKNIMKLIER